jgi:hypothetical protein
LRHIALSLGLVGAVACASSSEDAQSSEAANTAACGAEEQLAAFDRMRNAPLIPMRSIAGLDLANPDWSMATLADAEKTLCQSTRVNESEDAPVEVRGWGLAPNRIFTVDVERPSGKIAGWTLGPGYRGKLEFRSRPSALGDPTKPNPFGQHVYAIGLGGPILRDGRPWEIKWGIACTATATECFDRQATELFDGILATFAPELPSTQESCIQEQLCLARQFFAGEGVPRQGMFGARPLGLYFVVDDTSTTFTTPAYFYGFPVKTMPFSSAELFVRLGGEGPVARTPTALGDRPERCTMKAGMPFEQVLASCVEVLPSPAQNEALRAKLLGGAKKSLLETSGRMEGRWQLAASGIAPSFEAIRFAETKPEPSAALKGLTLDIRAGKVLNDFTADGRTLTLLGTTAVYREYVRVLHAALVEKGLATLSLGAPACVMPMPSGMTEGWTPDPLCTGLEQLVIPGDPATTQDLGLARMSAGISGFGWQSALKPTTPVGTFCADLPPNPRGKEDGPCFADVECRSGICGLLDGRFSCRPTREQNYRHCTMGTEGFTGWLFPDTMKQLEAVLGKGKPDGLPAELRDPAFYLRAWTKALVTYLRVADQQPTDLSAFGAQAPRDEEITIRPIDDVRYEITYLDRFSYRVLWNTGAVESMTFR